MANSQSDGTKANRPEGVGLAALIRELLDYDPKTGRLVWKARAPRHFHDRHLSSKGAANIWNAQHAGQPALQSLDQHGYMGGSFFDGTLKAHRAAFAVSHGRMPDGPVAHLNGNRSDNRICNLLDGTAARSRSRAGGVYRVGQRWAVRICVRNTRDYLGTFATEDLALAARDTTLARFGFSPLTAEA